MDQVSGEEEGMRLNGRSEVVGVCITEGTLLNLEYDVTCPGSK